MAATEEPGSFGSLWWKICVRPTRTVFPVGAPVQICRFAEEWTDGMSARKSWRMAGFNTRACSAPDGFLPILPSLAIPHECDENQAILLGKLIGYFDDEKFAAWEGWTYACAVVLGGACAR